MKIESSERGFNFIRFKDRFGEDCSLQQSSVIGDGIDDGGDTPRPGTSLVWLGVHSNRMHLDREQVKELIGHLSAWLETGTFDVK